ncbi:N-alpha-acetyltransferase 38, NatC auxiliary subunit-like [Cimex lectularius]|uniref:Sm domain-containing protein n=1 Tax=Cimex lectularius TaxID=79782 RepID=A0A8I6SM01_CIMLE|nr:N-alpha-acetyltransferase 38, NatC auxiliary subunit-like [Cimex lectularius]
MGETEGNEIDTKEKLNTLKSWLNKIMKIVMTDGRVLVGTFLCTDRDANVILGACTEYVNFEVRGPFEESRVLGLVMVPGRHIVSIHLDVSNASAEKEHIKTAQESSTSTQEGLYT